MRSFNVLGFLTRSVALRVIVVFFGGTFIGSILPEFGNVLAERLGLWSHQFNVFFLTLGIIGIVLACVIGYKSCR